MMIMYDVYDDYEVIVINALHTWLATILFDPLNWLFRFLSQAIAMRMDCKHDIDDNEVYRLIIPVHFDGTESENS